MHRLTALALSIAIGWFVVAHASPESPAARSTALARAGEIGRMDATPAPSPAAP